MKKHNITSIIVFLILVVAIAPARDKRQIIEGRPPGTLQKVTARPVDAYMVHNVGKVWTATSNFGNYGDPNVPEGLPSMEWPGGSGTHHLWEGRLWISALVEGEKRCSHADYGQYEWHPTEGTTFDLPAYPSKSVEDSYCTFDDYDGPHTTAPLGLRINQRGLTWSTTDYDDFVIYELEVMKDKGGDAYSGDELNELYVSWTYDCDVGTGTDASNPHIDDAVDFDGWDGNNPEAQITYKEDLVENGDLDGDGVIEGYDDFGIPYGWKNVGSPSLIQPNYEPSLAYPDGFYDEYTVFIPEDNSNSPVIRWQLDAINPDYIATAGEVAVIDDDTLRGYVIPRNMSYMYDADDPTTPEDDTNEGDNVPGFIGGRLIYTDYWKLYGAYNDTEDDTLMRVFSHQWWNWESDPATDRDKFDYATGTNIESRGNKFMPHPFDVGAPTFDYRFMLTTGPFNNFAMGDTIEFVYAAIIGRGIKDLRLNADTALEAYFAGSTAGTPYDTKSPTEDVHYLLPVPPPVPVLTYSPMYKGVKLSWDISAEIVVDPLVGAADFAGYRIYRSEFRPGEWELIAAFDNVYGAVYIINFETGDTLYNGQKFDLPPYDGNPMLHSFIDTVSTFQAKDENGDWVDLISGIGRPVNNLPYYYIVTAYDDPAAHGKPEFLPIESARANYKTNPETGAPEPVYPRKIYSGGEEWDGREVSVYPNPYRGASILEQQYEDKINFTNLPPACKISIFSLTGDLIKEIYHYDGTADDSWDLASRTELAVVSGLYLYMVEADLPTYPKKQVGRFVILRGD